MLRNRIATQLSQLSQKNFVSIFAHTLPALFVLGVGSGMIIGMLIGGIELAISGLLVTGIPFILSSIYIRKREDINTTSGHISSLEQYPLFQLFVIFYSVGGLYLSTIQERGYAFFSILTILYILAIASTFQQRPEQGIGFAIATLLMSIYSVTLRVPLFIGGTDILPHLSYTLHITNTGSIISEQVTNYANFPLYHILNASYIEIAGESPERSFFIVIGMTVGLTPLLVYSVASRLTHDRRFSCQVAVTYSTLPMIIYAGQYSITRTFAFIAFLIVIWSLLTKSSGRKISQKTILIIGITFLLLVHQVSYIQVLSLLFLWWGISLILTKKDKLVSRYDLMLFVIPFAAYWVYNAENFIIQLVISQIFGKNISPATQSINTSLPTFHIFEYTNAYLLGMLLLSGIVISLKSKNTRIRITALFTLLCTPLIIYSPIHIINRLKMFRIDRFVLLLSFFTALFVTIGIRDVLRVLVTITPNRSTYIFVAILAVFVFTGSLGGIYHDTAADSSQISWQQPKEHIERSERAALDHTINIPEGKRIRVDGISYKYLSSGLANPESKTELMTSYNVDTIQGSDDTTGEYMVYLKNRESRGNLVLGEYAGDYIYNGRLDTREKSQFYSSGSAALLTNTSR